MEQSLSFSYTTEGPEAMSWGLNSTNVGTFKEIKMDSNFLMLLASLVFAVSWVVYIAYYNSRVFGYIITKIVNRLFISEGYFTIGSFSFNALSGKIMFRDVVYMTYDYTARVQDGYLIFRWWRSYIPKDVSEDLSHSDTRLSIMLIGFELHVYNRCEVYSKLEEIFGLKEVLTEYKVSENLNNISESLDENSSVRKQRPEAAMARTWRDLIPVIKCDVSSSRLVFGNRLIPTTLSISFEESHFVYSTKPAVCTLDKFMHFVKCKGENVKVMLAPSLKYTGLTDQPPRYMGEGFVLMQSNNIEFYFYMDEPGLVPEEPVLVTLPNGDIVASSAPKWGIDVKCGKSTNFSYGPWADRQREHLFKFFYPTDYLAMEVTKTPKPGDKRQMESFDIRMLVQNDATIDILFTKDKETNAVHINIGAGSYLEATIPWVTKLNGYVTKVNGQLLHVEATTSLQYRDFIESETLEFCLECHYPLVWNDHQTWKINLTGCKATVHVIFSHKWFFQDMINDWASKQRPDLVHFVPYTWRIALNLKHCELMTLVNQYNWIDCSSVGQRSRLENTMFGLCAHFLHLSFDLPFEEYLPETIPLNFGIQGESIDLSLFIPEFHSSRNTVTALHKHSKLLSKDGGTAAKKTELIPKWRNVCKESDGWIDFWWVPIGAINIVYTYHPQPPLGPQPQADISTPVKEEILLSPMRFPHNNKKNKRRPPEGFEKFDPNTLRPDTVNVELEVGPSVLLLYGTALRNFMNFKENIFGEDQSFVDMQRTNAQENGGEMKTDDSSLNVPLELRDDFDKRDFRPLDVDVSIVVHDVQAHLLKNCTEKDPPCPVILVERLGFEMKKRYEQTELQLLLSPAVLLVSDNVNRNARERHLGQGKITLSSLQIRGHAMFSDVGRSLDQDTLEYAWLVEVQLGKLTGKLTAPQLCSLVVAMETLVFLVLDDENEPIPPREDDFAAILPPEQRKKSAIYASTTQPLQQAFQQFYTNVMVKNNVNSGGALGQQQQQTTTHQQAPNVGGNNGAAGAGGGAATAGVQFSKTGAGGDRNSKNNNNPKSANATDSKKGGGSLTKRDKEEGEGVGGGAAVNDGQECHRLKYKFNRVAVDALDLWLVESGTALQLWISPLRLSTCNLHGKQVNSGLSCIAYATSLRQLIWQQQKYNNRSSPDSDLWLEVGAVNFGPIIVESAISSAATSTTSEAKERVGAQAGASNKKETRQRKFLKTHDERQKKLWFLWPESNKSTGRCGCTGGCCFFGANRNGPRFFKPGLGDLEDGVNVAAFRINEPGAYPGYGQSILHEGMLVFRTTPYIYDDITLQDTSRRNFKMADGKSPRLSSRMEKDKSLDLERSNVSPNSSSFERRSNRRFSSSSVRSAIIKEVPYARLVETCPPLLTAAKLDSDSKLHTEKGKLSVKSTDVLPKNSISDSKLAVDYFNAPKKDDEGNNSGSDSDLSGRASSSTLRHHHHHHRAVIDQSDSQQSMVGLTSTNNDNGGNNAAVEGGEERLAKEVQRTTSMSSENHSEAFFSADEDLNSRSSSLRNSILSTGAISTRGQEARTILIANNGQSAKKKFSSELSIVTDRSANQRNGSVLQAPGSAPETIRTRLSSHRSDHEIHTPEHRSFALSRQNEIVAQKDDKRSTVTTGVATPHRNPSINNNNRSVSPRLWRRTSSSNRRQDGGEDNKNGDFDADSSSSGSRSSDNFSNNSFVSAQGSQEDFTLIDLHRQVNRPIVDSSMLMSSYVTHLTQSKCANWIDQAAQEGARDQFSLSLFDRIDDKLVYTGGRFVPYMETVMDGITSTKMVTKGDSNNKTPTSPFVVYSWEQEEMEKDLAEVQEEELVGSLAYGGSRTTVIVKLKGDLDVMISPLLLETLQRFVDSLTSTVAGLHPLTVVNHIRASCVSQVASANILQTTANVRKICRSENERSQHGGVATGNRRRGDGDDDPSILGSYEETIKTQLQAAIFLPKVNVTFLQVSIVEEIISFSALDNVKDLTCVSLLSVCFENIVVKLHCDKQAKEVLRKFHRPAVVQTGSKKGANRARLLLGLQTYTNADIIKGEPVFIERCRKLQRQLVVCLNVGKAHGQLRRLRNESSLLDDAVITAIPSYKSRVSFTPARMRPLYRGVEYYLRPAQNEFNFPQPENDDSEEKQGFIMFECGLEGITLKIVKKSQFEEETDNNAATTTTTGASAKIDVSNLDSSSKSQDDFEHSTTTVEESKNSAPSCSRTSNYNNNTETPKNNARPTSPSSSSKRTRNNNNGGCEDDHEREQTDKDAKNVSSCVIDLKVVWFNFAAPPRAPITRKIDYTRLDWNLLSTVSPAINAWMNPSNRLAIRVVHLVRTMYRRSTATVACLMAEALDIQRVHTLPKSRYGKLTPLSQTLQNDPSLQLCSIIQRYYLEIGANVIETNLKESEMPQLFTLRQGIVVLSRQWKNILYTPLLGQQHTTAKSRVKPMNITISVPEVTEEMTFSDSGEEEHDITDENARLLGTIYGTDDQGVTTSSARSSGCYLDDDRVGTNPQIAVVPGGVESILTSPSPPVPQYHRRRKKSLPQAAPPNSSRASVVLPLLNNSNGYPFVQKRGHHDDSIGYGALREDRTIINMGSDPSDINNSGSSPEIMPSSPLHRTLGNTNFSEDMYSWMAKQDTTASSAVPLEGCLESKINTVRAESSASAGAATRENNNATAAPEISLAPIQDSGRLLDANQIFQPLLSVLGVIPQQLRFTTVSDTAAGNEVTTLDALGSNFCLVGGMDTMRIDIVVSEADYGKIEKKKGRNNNKKQNQKFFIDILDESPSFVCEKISVELEIERVADMDVNEMMKTDNVFYISRSQLKNHTSTVINFTVGVHYISQRVNMPLLRLLHQISNMYQNVKDARNELHEQQPPTTMADLRRSKTSASDHHFDIKSHRSSENYGGNRQLGAKISDGSSANFRGGVGAVSPSASMRSSTRVAAPPPQSFAQKLMSSTTTKTSGVSRGGYVNLNEGGEVGGGVGTPVTVSSPSGSALDRATVASSSDKSCLLLTNVGRCWKTIYHLIELYSNMPETKTINHNKFSTANNHNNDTSEYYKDQPQQTTEHSKLVVFGVARIHRTKLLATLSGLKLEAEITSLHSSLTCRNRTAPNAALEYSITGQVGRTMIVLLEGVAPDLQTVVKVTIGKSQTLYSSVSKRTKDKNAGLLTIGAVNIDIPQHPVALHGMVTRGSKQLSSTIQELRVTRTASRMSRGQQMDDDGPSSSPNHPFHVSHAAPSTYGKTAQEKGLLQPLVMQFSVILQSLSITAALLPSLQAQYKMDQVNSTGFTGSKAKFTIDLPHHSLSFNTKLRGEKSEANLPSEASISLPPIHVGAEYVPENSTTSATQGQTGAARSTNNPEDGAVLKPGGYLNAKADIGTFRHSLTTDLLNHLVFVQKVFMKEINEVVQKVYGGERPVPLWLEGEEEGGGSAGSSSSSITRVLFSLVIKIQGIEITATTAGSSAVRLETGEVVFELSNRIQNISGATRHSTAAKLFGKAQVDLKLSLGQLIRNAIFEEAEIEFQPVAFFNTRIGLRNAFQDEIVEGEDKEVVLLTLKRPLVYVQPAAIDKAILVWLNYKNAYDYWNEKRANLNREMHFATNNQIYERFASQPHHYSGTLFVQLTVEDMGICLPLNPLPIAWNQRSFHDDSRGAVVVTLENTSISACSSGSLVSKGKFSNLCLRFADDFENSFDDWKPDMNDSSIMNLCVVSDGTYDFCSRTIAAKQPHENAKWFLSVQWQMEGVDIHLDTNIGKQLSALGHTLTMLTGAEEAPLHVDYDSDENEPTDGVKVSQESILKAIGAATDQRARSKAIEKAMNEQAKIINDLRSLGASHGTIEDEMKKLHELEELVYRDFRRDMIQKLRRQSVRASSIKRKFGLGDRGDSFRSKSFVMSRPMPERDDSPDNGQAATATTTTGSYESSPTSGPSRSSSLRVKNNMDNNGLRVHFNEQTTTTNRKSSLPSACSDLSITGSQMDWVDQLDIDGEKVQMRNKNGKFQQRDSSASYLPDLSASNFSTNHNGAAPSTASSSSQKPQEPNVDLELDVKVFINSGKCVLHTKDGNNINSANNSSNAAAGATSTREEEMKMTRMKKDRSCSAGLLEFTPLGGGSSSPDPMRRNNNKDSNKNYAGGAFGIGGGAGGFSSRFKNNPHPSLVDLTIFHIPGMDVKLHYSSKVIIPAQEDEETTEEASDGDGRTRRQDPTTSLFKNRRPSSDLEKAFNNTRSFSATFSSTDESEEMLRIERAFKMKSNEEDVATPPIPTPHRSMHDIRSSSSMHGISNPNYFEATPVATTTTTTTDDLSYSSSTTSSDEEEENNSSTTEDDHAPMVVGVADETNATTVTTPPATPISDGMGGADNVYGANRSTATNNNNAQRKVGVKKAQLFAWMTLQSVPEETIISPHILEFLEQTLEPIPPAKSAFETGDTSVMSNDQENINYGNYVYASFPVDVIVYFHMQPSTFRFSCLPVSRVECLLQLPSLDIVFSSKRAEDELLQSEFGEGNNHPNVISTTAVGGLSVTGCLSDFSVYIFHPYGGKKTTLKESQWSPLSDSERKDSLSINVEFVKIHLSRSRMLNFQQQDVSFKGKMAGDQSQRAVIRFSTITDIGSASFKYDMRRLAEILAFPKAWYRRSIVRRMFLGDLGLSSTYPDENEATSSSSHNSSPGTYNRTHDNRPSRSSDKSPLLGGGGAPILGREKLLRMHGSGSKSKEYVDYSSSSNNQTPESLGAATSSTSTTEIGNGKSATSWETVVLFAVNFKKLNVHMNMGNVMGNVSWLTKEFRSDGRLSIGSTGHKNLYIALGLGGSGLDAKGGIVGGNIEIANIDTFIHIREEPDSEPDHTVGVRLHALELRLDYMATSVLMYRVSDLKVNLRDEWKSSNRSGSRDSFMPTRRPAMIFMHGDLGWDQLQMMISKSTTTDLLKMFNKLEEFFSQQFNSSKRAFSGYSSSRPSKVTPQKAKDPSTQQSQTSQIDAKHHRHWQRVLSTVAGLQLTTMPSPLPPYGTVLGGTMELHGNNISLACFHGINFKSKSWALFSLKEPCITFNTEAQEIPSSGENAPAQDVHIVQTLTCSLGLSTYKTHLSMATVCKVSRTVIFPPQFKSLQEWFHYTFASSQIDEVDRFPSLEREKTAELTNSIERGRGGGAGGSQKMVDPNHNREVIFAIPSLQLHLKTEHLQTSNVPDLTDDKKPYVECSFITEFEDHIFVTVDAEAFFFLHDLITSYIREKERVLGGGDKRNSADFQEPPRQRAPPLSSEPKKSTSSSIDSNNIFSTDWRDFECKTWHLEPTVRLLSVAGKYIEPYGIDYILQKLGFSHARVTIPKWMQRGFMDPLDATLAVLTLKMVQVVRGDGNSRNCGGENEPKK